MQGDSHISTEFAAAFLEAQKIMENPAKTNTANIKISGGGSYSYKYAGLDDTVACVKAALNANDITVTQPTVTDETGRVGVNTVLTYKTGEMWDLGMIMMKASDDPQKVGSLITYLRRYGLSSGVGVVAEEDDDGAAGTAAAKAAALKTKKAAALAKKKELEKKTGTTTDKSAKPKQHIERIKAHCKLFETKYDQDRAQIELVNASEYEQKDKDGNGTGVMIGAYTFPTDLEDAAVKKGLPACAERLNIVCHRLEDAWKKDLAVKAGD